ncbi:MAG: hypothetical protein OZ921_00015 [Sorangiineae bacterium]|nr:hypothetical protein [Polyangiaceae bacterium]MEB2320868.1 hypothetical protein [Sorangiineae bacterium]
MTSRTTSSRMLVSMVAAVAAFAGTLLAAAPAGAQIKEPGNHPKYSVELEPHLLLQWSYRLLATDGYGLGARVNIPFLGNGPIPKINNDMAIGVGLDWAHFSGNCWGWGDYRWNGGPVPDDQCRGNDFWVPVVLKWNFYLTKVISVFGEPGLAIEHSRWDYRYLDPRCGPNGVCDGSTSSTDLEPVLWLGARFMFSDTVGATVRLGTPYVSAGVSILF